MTSRFDDRAGIISRTVTTMCLACACIAARVPSAMAAPIIVGGGYDYVASAGGQQTRSALAILAAPLGSRMSATLAGIRYDDASVGSGNGALAGLTLGVTPLTRFRAWGTRYVGDQDFRAWRVKAGPEATLPAGGTLGVFYAHDENNLGDRSNSAIAELGMPIVPSITGRVNGSFTATHGAPASMFGSLGLGWAPLRNFEITGDVGRASHGAINQTSSGPRSRLPLLGGGESTATSSESERPAETVLQLGVRLLFP